MTRLEGLRQALDKYLEARETWLDDSEGRSYEQEWALEQDFIHAQDVLYRMVTPTTLEQLIVLAEGAERVFIEGVMDEQFDMAMLELLEEEE